MSCTGWLWLLMLLVGCLGRSRLAGSGLYRCMFLVSRCWLVFLGLGSVYLGAIMCHFQGL